MHYTEVEICQDINETRQSNTSRTSIERDALQVPNIFKFRKHPENPNLTLLILPNFIKSIRILAVQVENTRFARFHHYWL